jgi:hypothetical protein
MELRQFYYDKYKDIFGLFENFIYKFGQAADFGWILAKNTGEISLEDKEFPLYDYFFSAMIGYYVGGVQETYDLSVFKAMIDPKLLSFLASNDGKTFIIYDKLKSREKTVSVAQDAILSQNFVADVSYKPQIINPECYIFLSDFKYKYIKELKTLSYIRQFLKFQGNGTCFLELDEGSFLKDMYSLIELGELRFTDAVEMVANYAHQEDILDFISYNNE